MFREFQEGFILFPHAVQDPYRADFIVREANNLSPGPAEFPLQRLNIRCRSAEMLLEQFLENVHDCGFQPWSSQNRSNSPVVTHPFFFNRLSCRSVVLS